MRNEYRLTWKLYRTWMLENMLKKKKLFFLILYFLLGVGCVYMAVTEGFLRLFYTLLAVFCFYRALFRDIQFGKKQYARLAQAYGEENWTRTIEFREEDIYIAEGNLTIKYLYKDILRIREKDDKVWLDAKDQTAIRLYKSAFVEGNWEECKKKITESM